MLLLNFIIIIMYYATRPVIRQGDINAFIGTIKCVPVYIRMINGNVYYSSQCEYSVCVSCQF